MIPFHPRVVQPQVVQPLVVQPQAARPNPGYVRIGIPTSRGKPWEQMMVEQKQKEERMNNVEKKKKENSALASDVLFEQLNESNSSETNTTREELDEFLVFLDKINFS